MYHRAELSYPTDSFSMLKCGKLDLVQKLASTGKPPLARLQCLKSENCIVLIYPICNKSSNVWILLAFCLDPTRNCFCEVTKPSVDVTKLSYHIRNDTTYVMNSTCRIGLFPSNSYKYCESVIHSSNVCFMWQQLQVPMMQW